MVFSYVCMCCIKTRTVALTLLLPFSIFLNVVSSIAFLYCIQILLLFPFLSFPFRLPFLKSKREAFKKKTMNQSRDVVVIVERNNNNSINTQSESRHFYHKIKQKYDSHDNNNNTNNMDGFKYLTKHQRQQITPFQALVLETICYIPKGMVTTYKHIANSINCKSTQAIGQALRRNPFAPDIPCHRVIKSNLTIGGFHGSVSNKYQNKKRKHLEHEGVQFITKSTTTTTAATTTTTSTIKAIDSNKNEVEQKPDHDGEGSSRNNHQHKICMVDPTCVYDFEGDKESIMAVTKITRSKTGLSARSNKRRKKTIKIQKNDAA